MFGEPAGDDVRRVIEGAELIVASDLTVVECDRAIIRVRARGAMSPRRAKVLHARLSRTVADWRLMPVGRDVMERARRPFPVEPVRSLDAIHLASALLAADSLPDLALLSLDQRVRASGRLLGLRVLPE